MSNECVVFWSRPPNYFETLLDKSSISKGRFTRLRVICLEKQNSYRALSKHANFETKTRTCFGNFVEGVNDDS